MRNSKPFSRKRTYFTLTCNLIIISDIQLTFPRPNPESNSLNVHFLEDRNCDFSLSWPHLTGCMNFRLLDANMYAFTFNYLPPLHFTIPYFNIVILKCILITHNMTKSLFCHTRLILHIDKQPGKYYLYLIVHFYMKQPKTFQPSFRSADVFRQLISYTDIEATPVHASVSWINNGWEFFH